MRLVGDSGFTQQNHINELIIVGFSHTYLCLQLGIESVIRNALLQAPAS